MEVTLIESYFDPRNGGIGNHSRLIYEGLKKQNNVDVKLLSQENCLLNSSFPFHVPFFSFIDLKRLVNTKEYKNTDVFHALTAPKSYHAPKNKTVASVLDFIPIDYQNSYFKTFRFNNTFAKLYDKVVKSAVKCEMVIANNSDIKMRLNQEYGAELDRIEVIPPPISSKLYPIKKQSDDSFVVGTISNLQPRKRIDILIKSFLDADIEDSTLLIGGRGEELEKFKLLADGDERIKFLGFVADKDMNSFYNSLDVFVFPTAVEGYGMPMVEAIACGKPVITLSDGDIPSNIKEKTCVVNKEDLANVLVNREYSCDIKRNIEFYKEHSVENISSKLVKVYEKVI